MEILSRDFKVKFQIYAFIIITVPETRICCTHSLRLDLTNKEKKSQLFV
jgi:hypothetical protein